MGYQPPYTITPEILNRVAEISEAVGWLTVLTDQAKPLRLRRINRIRTIRGSLAIEGNTLSEAQITAVLEGERVIAPPREVQEVKNALAAYDRFERWRPEIETDLAGSTPHSDVGVDRRGRGISTRRRGGHGRQSSDPHSTPGRPGAAIDPVRGRPRPLGRGRIARG